MGRPDRKRILASIAAFALSVGATSCVTDDSVEKNGGSPTGGAGEPAAGRVQIPGTSLVMNLPSGWQALEGEAARTRLRQLNVEANALGEGAKANIAAGYPYVVALYTPSEQGSIQYITVRVKSRAVMGGRSLDQVVNDMFAAANATGVSNSVQLGVGTAPPLMLPEYRGLAVRALMAGRFLQHYTYLILDGPRFVEMNVHIPNSSGDLVRVTSSVRSLAAPPAMAPPPGP